jgi:predicted HTH transcriptional regulator
MQAFCFYSQLQKASFFTSQKKLFFYLHFNCIYFYNKIICSVLSRYIHNLILQGENQHLDFKYEISDAKKIARTFAAFANTNGGTLLIGVKDNGNISGIRTDEEAYMAEAAAHIYCKPPVNFTIIPHSINEKRILEVKIPESSNKPHSAPWKNDLWQIFVRVGDQNFIAPKVLTEVWKLKYKKDKLLVRYNDFEEKLFILMRSKPEITISDFIGNCNVKPYLAIKILANLIAIDLIVLRITENETFFRLQY